VPTPAHSVHCDRPSPDPAATPGPHTDYNLTGGYGLGLTGGVFIDEKGNAHPTPSASGTIYYTW